MFVATLQLLNEGQAQKKRPVRTLQIISIKLCCRARDRFKEFFGFFMFFWKQDPAF